MNETIQFKRNNIMDKILTLDVCDFIICIQFNDSFFDSFDRAVPGESDYCKDFKPSFDKCDTQDKLYEFRHELRFISFDDFFANHMLSLERHKNYYLRKAALKFILSMSKEEFENMIKTNTMPVFVPAAVGDPDYKKGICAAFFKSCSLDKLYILRGELRFISCHDFLASYLSSPEYQHNDQAFKEQIKRDARMNELDKMTLEQFALFLECGKSFFDFPKACPGDSDYDNNFKLDINQCSYEEVYNFRHELRFISREDFYANHLLSQERRKDYYERKAALEEIYSLNEEDFENKLNTNTLPCFVRVKYEDPDWDGFQTREIKPQSGFKWATLNRFLIEMMSIESFRTIAGFTNSK
jgi:hypothetical protein